MYPLLVSSKIRASSVTALIALHETFARSLGMSCPRLRQKTSIKRVKVVQNRIFLNENENRFRF